MKIIALNHGKETIVDDCDFPMLSGYTWRAQYERRGKVFYAVTSVRINGKQELVSMSRLIMSAKPGEMVDHQDHDTLNNRRYNLRVTNNSGNQMNARLRVDNKSGVCGVRYNQNSGRWDSYITVRGRRITLGSFLDKDLAIKARLRANVKYGFHGNHGLKRSEPCPTIN